jgi:hypothetical protein
VPPTKVIVERIRIMRNLKNSMGKMRRDVVVNIIYTY